MSNSKIFSVTKKEFAAYFASPIAFIFLGAFLLVSMFTFFWVEAFFARNIVDVRPLFEWMPVLLIFLVSALTMKTWSEERRMGTLEFLMTMPVSTFSLIMGKFFACLLLVGICLLLTIGLPISVAFLGALDWGPVFGAYLASLLLAGAYIAIGIFVSSRSDNQIVSLIVTILICFAFYLIGSDKVAALVGSDLAEFLGLLGSGSRFESINRGVLDFRDLYYYLSIIGIFLALTLYSLEKLKWSKTSGSSRHRRYRYLTFLLVANFLVANFWLAKASVARADLTQGDIYSVSDATKQILGQLQEPLLIRGYFSGGTHPLLAPLVPQIRDLILEYEIAGKGKVRSEFIDPRGDSDLEEEAHRRYGIKPVPFQISDKYQAKVVNSYFNVLVQYGDEYEVLGFQDLIEVKPSTDMQIDVQLRNLEYDLSRTIKKVLYGFRNLDSLLESLSEPAQFTGYISAQGILPPKLGEFYTELTKSLEQLKAESGGKFSFQFKNPSEGDGSLATEIAEKHGFRPMVASLFDPTQFFFYMLLEGGGKSIALPLPENLSEQGARATIESGLKRLSPGFLKTIGILVPKQGPQGRGMPARTASYSAIQQSLSKNRSIRNVDLDKGIVPEDIDLLLVLAPKDLDQKSAFAIDQFLMKGGSLILGTSPYGVTRNQASLNTERIRSGIGDMLKHYGIEFEDKMVYDMQNEPYPVPVRRTVGGFSVQEVKLIPYLPFPEIRGEGLNATNSITSGIPQVTLNWPSPLSVKAAEGRKLTELLRSSKSSWAVESPRIQPNFDLYPEYGFAENPEKSSYLLAAMLEGSFSSYYKDKNSPLLKEAPEEKPPAELGEKDAAEGAEAPPAEELEEEQTFAGVIDRSPDTARIIVFASNEFLADQTLQISASSGSERYMNSIQLVDNAIDWSLEDRALLSIKSRGKFARTLVPLTDKAKAYWEYGNYLFVLIGLLITYLIYRGFSSAAMGRYRSMLSA